MAITAASRSRPRPWSGRDLLGRLSGFLTSLCAVLLAVGGLLVAVGLDHSAAAAVVELAGALAGPFDGLFSFRSDSGLPDRERAALVNWGLAALAYLVLGRVLARLIYR